MLPCCASAEGQAYSEARVGKENPTHCPALCAAVAPSSASLSLPQRPRARSGPEPAVHRQRLYASHLGKVQPRIGAHDRATRRSRPCPHGCASTRAACRPRAHYRRPLAGNCGVNCGGSASHTYLVLCAAADYTAARAAGPGPRGTRQRRKERNPGSAGCSRTGCFLYSAVPRWRCWRRCVTPAPVTWARDGTDTHTYTRTHTHTQQNDKNNQRVVE